MTIYTDMALDMEHARADRGLRTVTEAEVRAALTTENGDAQRAADRIGVHLLTVLRLARRP